VIDAKSRITAVEATVVQKMIKATRQERTVFVPALTFLLLFASRQKVNIKFLKLELIIKTISFQLIIYNKLLMTKRYLEYG
jgi:phosphoglycerol transferase MdoB-like AlkP superfamily enzyme